MGVVKRAYLYVTRKKVRSILLFLIFFVSGLFLLTGLSIKQGAKKAAEDVRKTLTAGLRIETNIPDPYAITEDSINEDGEKVTTYLAPLIREHHIEEFLETEGVSGFYCDNLDRETGYTGLTLHPGYHAWCTDIVNGKIPLGGDVTEEVRESYKQDTSTEVKAHTNSFILVYDSEWHPAFVNGAVELVEGRHVRTGDVAKCVISDELAEKNGLKVGDKVTAQSSDVISGELYGSVYETEIVGIFHINFEQTVRSDYTYEEDILANTFFSAPDMDDWGRREYQKHYGYTVWAPEDDEVLCLMVVFVEDPALLDSVKEKLLAIDSIEWDYYKFGTYDKDYQTAAAPLLTMIKTSDALIIASFLGVACILFLVMAIWTRSRKYEACILSSVGVKKGRVLLQFVIESCSIAAVAFFAALLLAGPVVNLAGEAFLALFYSSGDVRGYEVVLTPGTSEMVMNLLPPAKSGELLCTVAFQEACFVFLLLTGTAAGAALVSAGKLFRRNPLEALRH